MRSGSTIVSGRFQSAHSTKRWTIRSFMSVGPYTADGRTIAYGRPCARENVSTMTSPASLKPPYGSFGAVGSVSGIGCFVKSPYTMLEET